METQYKKVGNKLYVISKEPIKIVNLDMTGIEQIYVQLECIDKFKELNPDYADIFKPINFYLLAVQNPDYMEGEDVKTYDQMYLTVELLKNGEVKFVAGNSSAAGKNISYSIDNGSTWTEVTSTTSPGVSLGGTLPLGTKILLKGTNHTYGGSTETANNIISSRDAEINVYGNIMSLIYGDDFAEQTTFYEDSNYAFRSLFNKSKVVNASNLILPATTLVNNCYDSMFYGCTSLTTAPELPATTLVDGCYHAMFYGCTALTAAPVLPATTLAYSCYDAMFKGCTSLVKAPELPATTLAYSCYSSMFENCTSLTTAPVLPATTLAYSCYDAMFKGCTSLVKAPELPATTLASSCYSGMFEGCTSLSTAPELPATTLTGYCYNGMFSGCTSLTTAPELPATVLWPDCYRYMFSGCTSLTTAPELLATKLTYICYESMFSGCTNLNYIKAMFTTTPGPSYTSDWVSGVSSTGTFVKNSAATWDVTGTSGIPEGWTVETASE